MHYNCIPQFPGPEINICKYQSDPKCIKKLKQIHMKKSKNQRRSNNRYFFPVLPNSVNLPFYGK